MKTFKLTIIALLSIHSLVFGQETIIKTDTVCSTYKIEPYSDERLTNSKKITISNIKYEYPAGWQPDFIIKEMITSEIKLGYEGDISNTIITAHPIDDINSELWEIHDSSDEVNYYWNSLIESIDYGCCGASERYRYFSLLNGNELLTCNSKLLFIDAQGDDYDKFIGYFSQSSLSIPINPLSSNEITGEFTYSNHQGKISNIVFIFDKEDEIYIWPPDKIYIEDKSGEEFVGKEYLDNILKIETGKFPFKDMYICIEFSKDEIVRLYFKNDMFDIQKTIIPNNIILHEFNGSYHPDFLNNLYIRLKKPEEYDLRLLRNEIFARHGHSFKNEDLRKYFEETDWYIEKPNFTVPFESLSNDEKFFLKYIQYLETIY